MERNLEPADSFTHRRRLGVDVHLCLGNQESGESARANVLYMLFTGLGRSSTLKNSEPPSFTQSGGESARSNGTPFRSSRQPGRPPSVLGAGFQAKGDPRQTPWVASHSFPRSVH